MSAMVASSRSQGADVDRERGDAAPAARAAVSSATPPPRQGRICRLLSLGARFVAAKARIAVIGGFLVIGADAPAGLYSAFKPSSFPPTWQDTEALANALLQPTRVSGDAP